MNDNKDSNLEMNSRRRFLQQISLGAIGLKIGSRYQPTRESSSGFSGATESRISFVTSKDQREAAYQSLKPLEKEIENAIGNKQVVIKINLPHHEERFRTGITDINFVRGILDFLKPVYDRKVIIGEGVSQSALSVFDGYKNFGFMQLEKEYNVQFIDTNDQPTTLKFIKDEKQHPLGIHIINTYLDPNVFLISATRIKTHESVIATLSLKNVVMGSPLNRYKQADKKGMSDKPKMHSGGSKGLSYNLFSVASMGVQPDLAVLDGVVGMEGNGPWGGTPIEQGVALASTDWLAADRIAVELMGIDYNYLKYLQWCAEAGMGQDNLSKITIIGKDYKPYVTKYKLPDNTEKSIEWIREDYKI